MRWFAGDRLALNAGLVKASILERSHNTVLLQRQGKESVLGGAGIGPLGPTCNKT